MSIEFRTKRLNQEDMLTTDQSAALVGVSRVTINSWIKSGRCMAIDQAKRGWRLPRWQFEPQIFAVVESIMKSFDGDGWRALAFFENPQLALGGTTPLHALITGAVTQQRIAELAEYQ